MKANSDEETERQERQAELLAQVRRQKAALLAIVRRQTDGRNAATVSTALPREENPKSSE
jgi:hypothetical protein